MREELLDTFLYELRHGIYVKEERVNYDTCSLILGHSIETAAEASRILGVSKPALYSRLDESCKILEIKGRRGILGLRLAYIKFLEDEIELLSS